MVGLRDIFTGVVLMVVLIMTMVIFFTLQDDDKSQVITCPNCQEFIEIHK